MRGTADKYWDRRLKSAIGGVGRNDVVTQITNPLVY